MSGEQEIEPPVPLTKDEIIDLMLAGACIQPGRGDIAAVVTQHGRCADDWEDMRREGWLSRTIAGTFVLSDAGRDALTPTPVKFSVKAA